MSHCRLAGLLQRVWLMQPTIAGQSEQTLGRVAPLLRKWKGGHWSQKLSVAVLQLVCPFTQFATAVHEGHWSAPPSWSQWPKAQVVHCESLTLEQTIGELVQKLTGEHAEQTSAVPAVPITRNEP